MAKFKSARPWPDEVHQLPLKFENVIEKALEHEGLRITQTEKIAAAIKKQSDFYIHQSELETPWSSDWARIAQWSYFFPLNYLRARRVFNKGEELQFFDGLDGIIELGPGLGAATLAICESAAELNHPKLSHGVALEVDPTAISEFRQTQSSFRHLNSIEVTSEKTAKLKGDLSKSLGVFSYVINELNEIPAWAFKCEALFILEPATHQDGRKLLKLRQSLIEKGFSIWAPCTHNGSCPLLEHSKKDWCHDRLHWDMPEWFAAIDKELPIRNNTLTHSYLLARKAKPSSTAQARIVGDMLHEKGKSRALVCRGEEREYLSWLHKNSTILDLSRGDLVDIPETVTLKGNELRF